MCSTKALLKADAVVMARVLHDWDDSKAIQLLRHAHSALPKGGKLFVVEMLLSEDSMMGSLCDLHLLMVTGGAERTVFSIRGIDTRIDNRERNPGAGRAT